MSRMREGWELTKKSWALLRANPQLFRFPIVGSLAAIALTAVLVIPGLILIEDEQPILGGAQFKREFMRQCYRSVAVFLRGARGLL